MRIEREQATTKSGRRKQFGKRGPLFVILATFIVLFVFGIVATVSAIYHFSRDLPSVEWLKNYSPPEETRVYADDGTLIGEFFKEKRIVVPLSVIPKFVQDAFIAAEDSTFWTHPGIDKKSILRAFWKNLTAGSIVQGGSTITQQVAKALFLSPEKSFKRKIKEMILALRMEKHLSKEEILYIYLNHIYLGSGAYGVEAASLTYFGKHVWELNLAEAAIIAGLPRAPSKYSPKPGGNSYLWKSRQIYVIRQMVRNGFISGREAEAALRMPVRIVNNKPPNAEKCPYFLDYVKRYVEKRYGEKALYEGGLRIFTTVDLKAQELARRAVRKGLYALDKRQGYRGPLQKLPPAYIEPFIQKIDSELCDGPLKGGKIYKAVVIGFDRAGKKVMVRIGRRKGVIPLANMRWARKPNPYVEYSRARIKDPTKALDIGDVVLVRPNKDTPPGETAILFLEQEPLVQAALICIENRTGYIRAMVGGLNYKKSQFNRAVQSRRQPGSAFKPIIYAAAIDKGYTPSTIILDSPVIYCEKGAKKIWKPSNYEETFHGPTLLRTALAKSRNIVTIKILRNIGVQYAINYARKLGIKSKLVPNLSLALGASGVSLLELTSAYTVFANLGKRIEPVFIKKIIDAKGDILEENSPPPIEGHTEEKVASIGSKSLISFQNMGPGSLIASAEAGEVEKKAPRTASEAPQVISPQTAYIMTHLLEEVVKFGTGWRVRALKRPVAGKTGTTNNLHDAWFIGYTPSYTTGVWVGFDKERPLGVNETGSRAASPIWLEFMKTFLEGTPVEDFEVPKGIEFAKIDTATGLLADSTTKEAVFEAYKEGSAPKLTSSQAQEKPKLKDLFKKMESEKELFR